MTTPATEWSAQQAEQRRATNIARRNVIARAYMEALLERTSPVRVRGLRSLLEAMPQTRRPKR